MKTTLIIDDGVMRRLKSEAASRGKTLSEVVETALRMYLDRPESAPVLRPLPTFDGGGCRADVADRDALYRVMEGR